MRDSRHGTTSPSTPGGRYMWGAAWGSSVQPQGGGTNGQSTARAATSRLPGDTEVGRGGEHGVMGGR